MCRYSHLLVAPLLFYIKENKMTTLIKSFISKKIKQAIYSQSIARFHLSHRRILSKLVRKTQWIVIVTYLWIFLTLCCLFTDVRTYLIRIKSVWNTSQSELKASTDRQYIHVPATYLHSHIMLYVIIYFSETLMSWLKSYLFFNQK